MTGSIQAKTNNMQTADIFDAYSEAVRDELLYLRQLIFDVADELKLDDLEETLKWGEPSYLTKQGSTLRVAWRKSKPKEYGIFFNCKTSLVETFKEVYHDTFKFEGNRAIIFKHDDKIPVDALKHCIELSLNYHKIKHLPLLGI